MENTLDKRIEDISQEVITVSGDREVKFSNCIRALYKKYRCPRTVYSLSGSNVAGEMVAKGLVDTYGGWFFWGGSEIRPKISFLISGRHRWSWRFFLRLLGHNRLCCN
jgi:hypothetical protein